MTNEKKKDELKAKQEVQQEQKSVEYATINFAFPMSRYEASEILKHPKGKVMKSFTSYMNKVVVSAARKYSTVPEGEIVTDCKVPIE